MSEFTEDVTGFDSSDLVVSNGTVSNFVAASASTYTFDITPVVDGAVYVNVASGVATDSAGNTNFGSNTLTRTFDGLIGLTANSLSTNLATPTLTGTVDDTTATVTVAVGWQTITATVSGSDWSAPIPSALAEGYFDIQVSATNSAGKTGSLIVSGGLVIDLTAPAVVSVTAATSGPTNASSTYTVTFSEPILSAFIDAGDSFATTPSVASVVPVTSGDRSTSFIVTVNPGEGEGVIRLDVMDAATTNDPAGNALSVEAGGFVLGDTVEVDTVAPAAEITSAALEPTDANPFTITFDESVSGLDATDIAVSNGSVVNFVSSSGSVYTFEVVSAGAGLVTATVPGGSATDAAGNGNLSATASRTFTGTVTMVEITTIAADPTNADAIPVTVTFSGDVGGFDESDVEVVNGSIVDFTAARAGSYLFNVVPFADGTVTITVPAGVATDSLGSPTAVATASIVSDRTAPTATVSAASATNSNPITFTITFTEDVAGFDEADVTVVNGSVNSFTPVDARTYTVLVAPATDSPPEPSRGPRHSASAVGFLRVDAETDRRGERLRPAIARLPMPNPCCRR